MILNRMFDKHWIYTFGLDKTKWFNKPKVRYITKEVSIEKPKESKELKVDHKGLDSSYNSLLNALQTDNYNQNLQNQQNSDYQEMLQRQQYYQYHLGRNYRLNNITTN